MKIPYEPYITTLVACSLSTQTNGMLSENLKMIKCCKLVSLSQINLQCPKVDQVEICFVGK